MRKDYLKKLADLAVKGGVNLQPRQTAVINADLQAADLARAIVKSAYDAGARECIVRWSDEMTDHENWIRADASVFEQAPAWKAKLLNDTAKEGACYIHIIGDDPELMKDVDPSRMNHAHAALNKAAKTYRSGLDNGLNAWTIVASPTSAWAAKVYPELPIDKAVEQLWDDIFAMSRIDDQDPLENWRKHNDSFASRIQKLNDSKFTKLHYQNAAGTDLWVELPEDYLFAGGGTRMQNGLMTYPNIPTEEIFSAPKLDGVNGKLVSTMPLNHNGTLINDLWFEFKDGKVVDFGASTGKEVIEELISTDDGACRLGEVALVPWGSPIQKRNRIFYNTLFDENASCHFALGKAYSECVKGGVGQKPEELKKRGLNDSAIHVDFMVGSDDLSITGYTEDGQGIPVFEKGKFTGIFE